MLMYKFAWLHKFFAGFLKVSVAFWHKNGYFMKTRYPLLMKLVQGMYEGVYDLCVWLDSLEVPIFL